MVRFCPLDQIFVDLLCGADVLANGVFVLTELSSQTQVLEEAKQKLSSLFSPKHIVVLRVLLLQHLEEQRKIWYDSMSNEITRDRRVDEKRKSNLSELIIVGVDIMKAFNHMSRGPQDPTRVDWVKQLHGDLSTWHQLHIDRHHWLVYIKHTQKHTQVKNIPLRFDCKYCLVD